jgi:hypothetical protein
MSVRVKPGAVAYRGAVVRQWSSTVYVEEAGPQGVGLVSRLPVRLDIMDRSPCGFSWGYWGAGPHQLALALLLHAFGVPPSPRRRDNVPIGEDPELDEERYREDEEQRAAREAALETDAHRPLYLDDDTALMPDQTTELDRGAVRLALDLHGDLVDQVIGNLPRHRRWVIWREDLLAWARAAGKEREAVAERIMAGALRFALTDDGQGPPLPAGDPR